MLLYDSFFPEFGQKKRLDIIMITLVSYIFGGRRNYTSQDCFFEITRVLILNQNFFFLLFQKHMNTWSIICKKIKEMIMQQNRINRIINSIIYLLHFNLLTEHNLPKNVDH